MELKPITLTPVTPPVTPEEERPHVREWLAGLPSGWFYAADLLEHYRETTERRMNAAVLGFLLKEEGLVQHRFREDGKRRRAYEVPS